MFVSRSATSMLFVTVAAAACAQDRSPPSAPVPEPETFRTLRTAHLEFRYTVADSAALPSLASETESHYTRVARDLGVTTRRSS